MFNEIHIPSDYNPGRKIYGTRELAKFVARLAEQQEPLSHTTIARYVDAGLIRPAAIPGGGSRPAVWYEQDIVEDLKSVVKAVEHYELHGRGRDGRVSLNELATFIEHQKEAETQDAAAPALATSTHFSTEQQRSSTEMKIIDWFKPQAKREGEEAKQEDLFHDAEVVRQAEIDARDRAAERRGMSFDDDKKLSLFERLLDRVKDWAMPDAGIAGKLTQDLIGAEAARPSMKHYDGYDAQRQAGKNAVEYRNKATQKVAFVDAGKTVTVHSKQLHDLQAALKHAVERSGKPLTVKGGDEFMRQTAAAAFALGCPDRLKGIPPQMMEEARKQHEQKQDRQAEALKKDREETKRLYSSGHQPAQGETVDVAHARADSKPAEKPLPPMFFNKGESYITQRGDTYHRDQTGDFSHDHQTPRNPGRYQELARAAEEKAQAKESQAKATPKEATPARESTLQAGAPNPRDLNHIEQDDRAKMDWARSVDKAQAAKAWQKAEKQDRTSGTKDHTRALSAENPPREGRELERSAQFDAAKTAAAQRRDTIFAESTGFTDPRQRVATQLFAQEQYHTAVADAARDMRAKCETQVEAEKYDRHGREAKRDVNDVATARREWQEQGMPSTVEQSRLTRGRAGFDNADNQILTNADQAHESPIPSSGHVIQERAAAAYQEHAKEKERQAVLQASQGVTNDY